VINIKGISKILTKKRSELHKFYPHFLYNLVSRKHSWYSAFVVRRYERCFESFNPGHSILYCRKREREW